MRIEWLSDDRRFVRVTRGFLWWKRVAYLQRDGAKYTDWWRYWPSHQYATDIDSEIDDAFWYRRRLDSDAAERNRDTDIRRSLEANWSKPAALPQAKAVVVSEK